MRVCQHATEVEHPSIWQELVSECNSVWYSFWSNCGGNHLFLPASSLPCYSLYLHSLTYSTLKLPHCRCSGSAFPNIKPTHAFSSFYIPLSSLSSASSFIPSSRAYWHQPCGCRPERKMMVVGMCFQHWPGFSERVLLGWRVDSAETWVVMLELCQSSSLCEAL